MRTAWRGLLLAVLLASPCQPQQIGAISGVITDSETKQPIQGVSVRLVNPNDQEPLVLDARPEPKGPLTYTDWSGAYRFGDVPPRVYRLQLDKTGYWFPGPVCYANKV